MLSMQILDLIFQGQTMHSQRYYSGIIRCLFCVFSYPSRALLCGHVIDHSWLVLNGILKQLHDGCNISCILIFIKGT